SSMCQGHTFLPASLPAGASDHLDRARTYGDDHYAGVPLTEKRA
ncbi:MAG: hypothetical protein QOH83_973, partial [Solirubrobacteraceae bacterium]|nr:hypothetical protein [Solirubrobacteraceae bacterium]